MILSDPKTIAGYVDAGVWGEATLDALFRKCARDTPDAVALSDPPNKAAVAFGTPRSMTYSQLDDAVDRLAATFIGLGLRPDDIVAVQLPNTVEMVCTLLAGMRAGLVISPLPSLWRRHEMLQSLPVLEPRALITCTQMDGFDCATLARDAAADLMSVRFVLGFGEDLPDGVMALDDVFAEGGDVFTPDLLTHAHGANDIATICWAGNAAPAPTAVARSHNQWIAAGLLVMLEAGLCREATLLNPYPMSGLMGIGAFFVPWLLAGGRLVQHHALDETVLLDQMAGEKITFTALPPMVIDVLHGELRFQAALRSGTMRALGCVWRDPVLPEPSTIANWRLPVPIADIRTIDELVLSAHIRSPERPPDLIPHGEWRTPANTPAGPVLLSTRVKGGPRTNAQSGSLLGGELMIKSPMLFDTYLPGSSPAQQPPAKNADGFVATGHACELVDGPSPMIRCVGHDLNVLYHGGISVAAPELDVLYGEYQQLTDAAAFAFDDPLMGDRILAAVVPSPGHTITLDDFVEYLRAREVAPYKIPDRLVMVKTIPRNELGQVQRDRPFDRL